MNRKICLTLALFLITLVCKAQKSVHHLDFLKEQNTSAKEYVLGLFEDYDIVVFCERAHSEFTQYELLMKIVSDPRFIDKVGHVYTEVGSFSMDRRINQFLASEERDSVAIHRHATELLRDAIDQPWWHCTSFPWFLTEIQKLNRDLPADKKIQVHPTDRKFDWNKIRTAKDYQKHDEISHLRDLIEAEHVKIRFDSIENSADPRKKALVIMNYKHAFLMHHQFYGQQKDNTGAYLKDWYGHRVGGVYLLSNAIPRAEGNVMLKDGKWDYWMRLAGKTDIGFTLQGSPFGAEDFDVIPVDPQVNFLYQDMFTGLLFYKPMEEHVLRTGWEGFMDEEFLPEFIRRTGIYFQHEGVAMSEQQIREMAYGNNEVKSGPYPNLDAFMNAINRWGSAPPANWKP